MDDTNLFVHPIDMYLISSYVSVHNRMKNGTLLFYSLKWNNQ